MKSIRELTAMIAMLVGLPLGAYYAGFQNASLGCDARYFETCYPALLDFVQFNGKLCKKEALPESADDMLTPPFKPSGFRYNGAKTVGLKKAISSFLGIFGFLLFVDTRLFWPKRHKNGMHAERQPSP